MLKYDKDEIKDKLTTDLIFDIVNEFGGEPRMTSFGFVSATICHNEPGEGSHKLYYYENTKLFRCYTECGNTFDIFELITKVKLLNSSAQEWGLYDSVRWIAQRYNWDPTISESSSASKLVDWTKFDVYDKLHTTKDELAQNIQLKEYDPVILKHLSYPVIVDWIREGITKDVMKKNLIGYYPGGAQITIPHFDALNRFIGLRGRALSQEEAELFGKYRPVQIGGIMYNHPLSMNLYNFNNSQKQIQIAHKAIIFEGEKSTLKYASYFGESNDISVACCGSSISSFQIKLLLEAGAQEIIVAFDKQFQVKGDPEFKHLVKNLTNIHSKYQKYAQITFMFDKGELLGYKDSPIDKGPDTFLNLYQHRIML